MKTYKINICYDNSFKKISIIRFTQDQLESWRKEVYNNIKIGGDDIFDVDEGFEVGMSIKHLNAMLKFLNKN